MTWMTWNFEDEFGVRFSCADSTGKNGAQWVKNLDDLKAKTILIKGAGEKASAVAYWLYQHGFRKIAMTDLPLPLAERRGASFCEAIIHGWKQVCGVISQKAEPSLDSIYRLWSQEKIPIIADRETVTLRVLEPDILIDAVMAKKNTGTMINNADLVIALGPGFTAQRDAHFVVETNPGSPDLGRVITEGQAERNTGIPTSILGCTNQRLIRSEGDGRLLLLKDIGDGVIKGETIGYVCDVPVRAEISGIIRGVVRGGTEVRKGQKIGDIDPRGERELCFRISGQGTAIAAGVLEGIVQFSRA